MELTLKERKKDIYNAAVILKRLGLEARDKCIDENWGLDWKEGGCYLHLETSEFIESLRGKKGTPETEAAQVLFILLGMMHRNGVNFETTLTELDSEVVIRG